MNYTERRKHKRFSSMKWISEPIEVHFPSPFYQEPIVGRIIDISAGGLGLMISEPLPEFFTLSFYIHIRGIEPFEVKGKVVHFKNDSETQFVIGIFFTEIDEQIAKRLDSISEDYEKCSNERSVGDKDFCFEECLFATFCDKKGKFANVHATDEQLSEIDIINTKDSVNRES